MPEEKIHQDINRSQSMASEGEFIILAQYSKQYMDDKIRIGENPSLPNTPPTKLPRQSKRKRWLRRKKEEAKLDMEEVEITEHMSSIEDLLQHLKTNKDTGLSNDEAAKRLTENGMNQLSPPYRTPWYLNFLKELTNPFAMLLWVGAVICFVAAAVDPKRGFFDSEYFSIGVVLAAVNFLTGCFGYYQNAKSSSAMEALRNLSADECTVVRESQKYVIDPVGLVVGDICLVTSGQKFPADLRLVKCVNFKVDNSSLTGESEEVHRSTKFTHDNPLETQNLAFFGTLAVNGEAAGVVIKTGDQTVMGHIAKLTTSQTSVETTLHREIHKFIVKISVIALSIGFFCFIIRFLIVPGDSFIDMLVENLVYAMSLIVANVPEGLLATLTLSLTLTAKRMRQKQVLVKNLETVETLGSCSCICSDKTGTLTENRMTITNAWFDLKTTTVAEYFHKDLPITFETLHRCATLCNDGSFDATAENMKLPILERKVTGGNSSDAGILKFAELTREGSVTEIRNQYPLSGEGTSHPGRVPFNSRYKFCLSLHVMGNEILEVMKGAPEQVLGRCTKIMVEGKEVKLTPDLIKKFEESNLQMARKGERVLGFAQKILPKKFTADFEWNTEPETFNFPAEEMTYLGVLSLVDPPRNGVEFAVQKCHSAGIQVIMVTGDQPATAEAIARQVGILKETDSLVVHGEKLQSMLDEELEKTLGDYRYMVFARTSPTQKLRICEAYKKIGRIVAMTGDGVNDSPALKAANIGVAMGSGTEVAISAADMILANDDFTSIVTSVEEGRLIFDNLKKSIAYTLSSNIPEIAPFLSFIIVGLPSPLTTKLILLIDLGSDLAPAISFAKEAAELDIMDRKPRDPINDSLVPTTMIVYSYLMIGMVQAMGGFVTYFTVMHDYGFRMQGLLFTAYHLEYEQFPPLRDERSGYFGNRTFVELLENGGFSQNTDTEKKSVSLTTLDWEDKEFSKLHLCGRLELKAEEIEIDLLGEFDATQEKFRQKCSGGVFTLSRFNEFCGGNATAVNLNYPDRGLIFQRTPKMTPNCDLVYETTDGVKLPVLGGFWTPTTQIKVDAIFDGQVCGFFTQYDDHFVCYSTEALNYSQSAFYTSIIVVQYATLYFCKTRKLSIVTQGLSNWFQNFAVVLETAIGLCVIYLPFANSLLQTRPLESWHFVIPAMPFAVFNFCFDEVRKFWIRKVDTPEENSERMSRFVNFLKKNTYY